MYELKENEDPVIQHCGLILIVLALRARAIGS